MTAPPQGALPATHVVKVPTIVQMEEVECGAASLAMILAHFGCWVPLEELRVTCGVSRDGANALSIVKAARHYGLDADGRRATTDQLAGLPLPSIIFWRGSHFVVLEGFRGDHAIINDPAGGRTTVTAADFHRNYSGIVLTFTPTDSLQRRPRPPIGLQGGLGAMLSRSWWDIGYIVAAGIMISLPSVLASVLTSVFVDQVIGSTDVKGLPAIAIGFVIVTVLLAVFTALQQTAMLRLQIRTSERETTRFLRHMVLLPLSYFDARAPGALVQKLQAPDQLAQLLAGPLGTVLVTIVSMTVYGIFMVLYSPLLALVGFAVGAVNLVALWLISRSQVQENVRQQNALVRQTATAFSGLSQIASIKATGSENEFFTRWAGDQARSTNTEQTVGKLTTSLAVIPVVLTIVNTVVVFTVGSLLIFDGDLTVGSLVAFQGLLTSFTAPLSQLVTTGDQFQSARALMSQIDDVRLTPPDPLVSDGYRAGSAGVERARLAGRIELRNITFGYNPALPPLLSDFTIVVEPGQRVAIVGASGSGKTTVGNIMAGLLQPWQGEVLLDNRPRSAWPRELVAASLAKVDQSIVLFAGTVSDNITLFDPDKPQEWVERAARDAQIYPDIIQRSGGFAAPVDEGGTNFSGGQGQRLEIARALAGNPSAIILDEATSALDALDEASLDMSLRARGITTVLIAHRLSTIRDSDLIVMLAEGKEVGRGTHGHLLATCPPYAQLVGSE